MKDVYVVHSFHETQVIDPEHPHPIIASDALAQAHRFLALKKSDPDAVLEEDPGYEVPDAIAEHIARSAEPDYEAPEMVNVIVVELAPEDPGQSTITYRIHNPSKDDRASARAFFKPGARLQLNWSPAK